MKKYVGATLILFALVFIFWGTKIQFLLGGAMVNLGYRLQDHLEAYDLEHHHATAAQVWEEFLKQNQMAASVRTLFPRATRHPVIALVTCMDARLDTNEIAGDTRRYYYVLRLAGSVLAEKEEEMLELAVSNGVRVVVFTTHTDCAAEKVAADPLKRRQFPTLSHSIDERAKRFDEFMGRPLIKQETAKGELIVKWMDLDTRNESVAPHKMAASRWVRQARPVSFQ
jgi:hypothetical protein